MKGRSLLPCTKRQHLRAERASASEVNELE